MVTLLNRDVTSGVIYCLFMRVLIFWPDYYQLHAANPREPRSGLNSNSGGGEVLIRSRATVNLTSNKLTLSDPNRTRIGHFMLLIL